MSGHVLVVLMVDTDHTAENTAAAILEVLRRIWSAIEPQTSDCQ